MQEENLNGGAHATETLGWFAIDSGTANDGDTILEGGITGNSFNMTHPLDHLVHLLAILLR